MFVSRLRFALFNDVESGAGLFDVLVAHDPRLNIDIEALTGWGVIGTDLV